MCVSTRWLEVVLRPWWGRRRGLAGGGGLPARQPAVPCQPGAPQCSESSTLPVARLQSTRWSQAGGQKSRRQTNPEVRLMQLCIMDGPTAAVVDQLFSVFLVKASLGVGPEQHQQRESGGGGGRGRTLGVCESSGPAGQEGLRLHAPGCVFTFTHHLKASLRNLPHSQQESSLMRRMRFCLQIQGSTTTHPGCSGWVPAPGCLKGRSSCIPHGCQRESWRCLSCRKTSTPHSSQVPHNYSNVTVQQIIVCIICLMFLWDQTSHCLSGI